MSANLNWNCWRNCLLIAKYSALIWLQHLSTDSEKVDALLDLWLLWWRDLVLAANNCLDLTVNVDMRDLLKKQAAKVGSAEAERMIRAILSTREAIEQNVNARVAFEVLMLDMPTEWPGSHHVGAAFTPPIVRVTDLSRPCDLCVRCVVAYSQRRGVL